MADQDTLPAYPYTYGSFDDNDHSTHEEDVHMVPQEERMPCIIVVEEDIPYQSCCSCCTCCCSRSSGDRSSARRQRRQRHRGPSIIQIFISILMIIANLILMGTVFEMGAASTSAAFDEQEVEVFEPEIMSKVKHMDAISPDILERAPNSDHVIAWDDWEMSAQLEAPATEGSGMNGKVKRSRRVPHRKESVEENQRATLQIPGQTYRL